MGYDGVNVQFAKYFQLVNDRFDNSSFSQQNLIEDWHELVFHIRFDANDGLDVEIAQEIFKKSD